MEALDQLYINGWTGNVFSSAQAARNLIDLATGATLGALWSAPPHAACLSFCFCRAVAAGLPLLLLIPPSCAWTTVLPACCWDRTAAAFMRPLLLLLNRSPGPAAGELGSLEEVIKEFIHKQFLRPVMLHELWDVASRAHQAMEQRAAGAERWAARGGQAAAFAAVGAGQVGEHARLARLGSACHQLAPSHAPPVCRAHRDLRAALAILSMAAATRPEAFTQQQVEDLLRFGFSPAAADALITRHACITLQRLASNCKAG